MSQEAYEAGSASVPREEWSTAVVTLPPSSHPPQGAPTGGAGQGAGAGGEGGDGDGDGDSSSAMVVHLSDDAQWQLAVTSGLLDVDVEVGDGGGGVVSGEEVEGVAQAQRRVLLDVSRAVARVERLQARLDG